MTVRYADELIFLKLLTEFYLHCLQESRPMEKVAQVVASSLDRWGKFSIPTVTVAQAMVKNALRSPQKSVEIIDHAQFFIWRRVKGQ